MEKIIYRYFCNEKNLICQDSIVNKNQESPTNPKKKDEIDHSVSIFRLNPTLLTYLVISYPITDISEKCN